MKNFTVFPAMDILDGKVVRLKLGQRDAATHYDDDVIGVANRWIDLGANWLHVVNLSGAFGTMTTVQQNALKSLIAYASGKVNLQVGGGIRTLEDMQQYFDWGAKRLIISTLAVNNPDLMRKAIARWGADSFLLAVDAKKNQVQTYGWQSDSGMTPVELALQYRALGLKTLLFTSIEKDGMGTGVATDLTTRLQDESDMDVIASGGANTIEDVIAVKAAGLSGIVLGRALYEGTIDLQEALRC